MDTPLVRLGQDDFSNSTQTHHDLWNDTTLVRSNRELQAIRLDRIELLQSIRDNIDPIRLGYSHRKDFSREELGISSRTWQNAVRLARNLASLPLSRRMLRIGIVPESKLLAMLPVATAENEWAWLGRCVKRSVSEVDRLVKSELELQAERGDRNDNAGALTNSGSEPGSGLDSGPGLGSGSGSGSGLGLGLGLGLDSGSGSSSRVDTCDDGTTSVTVCLSTPPRSAWVFRAFVESATRRLGHYATSQNTMEVALAEFSTTFPSSTWARVVRRRQWPPTFVTDVAPSSHSVRSHPMDNDPQSASKNFEFRWDGVAVETPGPWLACWKTQATFLEIKEPVPGDPTWAFYHGIMEDQTDGISFVTSRPPTFSCQRESGSTCSESKQLRRTIQTIRKHELDRAAEELYSNRREECSGTADDRWSDRYHDRGDNRRSDKCSDRHDDSCNDRRSDRHDDSCNGRHSDRPIDDATSGRDPSTATPPADAATLLTRFREIEAIRRVLSQQIHRCLAQIRNDQSWREFGFHSFEDYVEFRLGITYRTANQWIRTLRGSDVLRDAEADQSLRSSALLALIRLQKAGASEGCLARWHDHTTEVTIKILDRQVRWVLAHEELRSGMGPLDEDRMPLAPPSASIWKEISTNLLATPSVISSVDFHEFIAQLSETSLATEGPLKKIFAPASNGDDVRKMSAPASERDLIRRILAYETEAGDAGQILARGAHDTNKDPAKSSIAPSPPSPTVHVPDPREETTSRLFLDLHSETAEQLARTLALIRGAYGEDKPDWWCLEVLLLHVQAGWIPEDQDFRRRTAGFAILARDGFQCTVPVCTARRELMVHHIVYRSAGGNDDPANRTTVCAACHLQGIHEQRTISVSGSAPNDLEWRLGA